MKPKLTEDKKSFTADFTVNERRCLLNSYLLATLCAKLEIAGAEAVASGIEDLLGACGYEGELETEGE